MFQGISDFSGHQWVSGGIRGRFKATFRRFLGVLEGLQGILGDFRGLKADVFDDFKSISQKFHINFQNTPRHSSGFQRVSCGGLIGF